MKRHLLMLICLLTCAPVLANAPEHHQPPAQASATARAKASGAAPLVKAERRAPPCKLQTPHRAVGPQGTLLWGMETEEGSSVLTSVDLDHVQLDGAAIGGVQLKAGRLVALSRGPRGLVSAVLQGTGSDGQPVEVALCGAEPDPGDSMMEWYRIQVWNPQSATWESPCVATSRVPHPRALAVQGVWDGSGARNDIEGKFTFACETGAIAKCIAWGYKPWAQKEGQSLEPLHQACTRMARADYCGTGRSHTRPENPIDFYDDLQLLTRTLQRVAGWEPDRASFEAAWDPEGAVCLSRTRDGSALETILAECPGRFEVGERSLEEGARCTLRRKGEGTTGALVHNRSYGKGNQGRTAQPEE
jgi:hypothetical protein